MRLHAPSITRLLARRKTKDEYFSKIAYSGHLVCHLDKPMLGKPCPE